MHAHKRFADDSWKKVTIQEVLALKEPTKDFLCPLWANTYNIQFIEFKIRDYDTNQCFFEVKRDPNEEPINYEELKYVEGLDEEEFRTVRYNFGPNFFKLSQIGTTLTFSVGNKPVKKFRMIERHYFRKQLIQSFDFEFPFCIPDSTNTWDSIYTIPKFDEKVKEEMINSPWETKSDSFYFVDGVIAMHNKAEYNYSHDIDIDDDDDDDDIEEAYQVPKKK